MFNVVLVHPEIPPNTGNIIRLCANTGCTLHLIEPFGFPLDSSKMRRAGLDYHELANIQSYPSWNTFMDLMSPNLTRLHALTTKSNQTIANATFEKNDFLIFGSETKGLPNEIRSAIPQENHWRLPMLPNNRSLNLSNSVAVVIYDAWRQNNYEGGL